MTAKEMFEKLGYELIQNDMYFVKYGIHSTEWYAYFITFDLKNKKIEISNKVDTFGKRIDLEELKAINKQIEELGWDNE